MTDEEIRLGAKRFVLRTLDATPEEAEQLAAEYLGDFGPREVVIRMRMLLAAYFELLTVLQGLQMSDELGVQVSAVIAAVTGGWDVDG